MNNQELKTRYYGICAWLERNIHSDFYYGVMDYKNKLKTLLTTTE